VRTGEEKKTTSTAVADSNDGTAIQLAYRAANAAPLILGHACQGAGYPYFFNLSIVLPRSFTAWPNPFSRASVFTFACPRLWSDFQGTPSIALAVFLPSATLGRGLLCRRGLVPVALGDLARPPGLRYFLILDLASFLWSLQTIPKIGAATFFCSRVLTKAALWLLPFRRPFHPPICPHVPQPPSVAFPGPRFFCGIPKTPAKSSLDS